MANVTYDAPILEKINKLAEQSRGHGVWIVVYFGRTGSQLAHVEPRKVGSGYLYAKKWRRNSGRMTKEYCLIKPGEILRIATPDDIRRSGLTAVGR